MKTVDTKHLETKSDAKREAEAMKHKWVYDGKGGGHRGEYDFTCLRCGESDWVSGRSLDRGEKPNDEGCAGKRPTGTSYGSPEFPSEYARGVADERARVVADLRAMAKGLRGITLFERNRLDKAADRYERGEHTKEGA